MTESPRERSPEELAEELIPLMREKGSKDPEVLDVFKKWEDARWARVPKQGGREARREQIRAEGERALIYLGGNQVDDARLVWEPLREIIASTKNEDLEGEIWGKMEVELKRLGLK